MTRADLVFALACAFLLIGCVSLPGSVNGTLEMKKLQEKYALFDGFSPNTAKMNDYISELSIISSNSSGETTSIVNAELYSAQTFYYLSKAMDSSKSINFNMIVCSSKEVKETRTFAKIALEKAGLAEKTISSLNGAQLAELRTNLLDTVKGYGESANKIIRFFDQKC
jgi:hypothetical protein